MTTSAAPFQQETLDRSKRDISIEIFWAFHGPVLERWGQSIAPYISFHRAFLSIDVAARVGQEANIAAL